MPTSLIRHVESEYNKTGVDTRNCNITEKAKEDASKITGHYHIILQSPLKRCEQTLHYSRLTYDKLIVLDIIREHKLAECDFMEDEDKIIEQEYEVLDRVEQFKKYLKELPDNQEILVITHGDFVWYLTSKVINGERFGTWLNNGELLKLNNDDFLVV
ncbi:MAG: phosphohistidine phosphatase [Terrestrivirus sp.]|uniref:Phosphohistidine phosphatase n=1 Tax=Terrestrivirus sp. TaxID=2487775 RepID=A0A3G4ZLF3_9VIRU|nr:MAG: phosphohistidine phosphatase [Terrestrivirus sp.]